MTTPCFPEPTLHDGQIIVGTGPDRFQIDVDETFTLSVFVERETRAAHDAAAIIVIEGLAEATAGNSEEPNTVALRVCLRQLSWLICTLTKLRHALDDGLPS